MERYDSELNRQRVTNANQDLNAERLQNRVNQSERELTSLKEENRYLRAEITRLRAENAGLKEKLGDQDGSETPITDRPTIPPDPEV